MQMFIIIIDNKLNNYSKIKGIRHNMFRPQKTWKKTRITLYSLALPALLYSSENWAVNARKITAADMKYTIKTAGYTWTDHRTNTEIAKELNITPVLDQTRDYRRNCIQRENRMPRNRIRRIIKKITDQKGKGTRGDHWRDFWMCETERVNKWPNSMIARWWWWHCYKPKHVADYSE